jgi:HlyD family secretion protein
MTPRRRSPLHYWGLPALAALMLAFALWSVIRANQPHARAEPPTRPPEGIFAREIAGTGIVEPNSETIAVATELGGVVTRISVKPGAEVETGAPLFAIDDNAYRASRDAARAAVAAKRAAITGIDSQIERQGFIIDSARAAVEAAQADLDRTALDRGRYDMLSAETVASRQRLETAVADNRKAEAALAGAKAALVAAREQSTVLMAAREEAEAALAEAEALLARAEIDLGRTVVRAPIAGEVLKIDIHLGEYAQPGALAQPLMLMGAVNPLHVRVDIDETDLGRFVPGARAVAQLRGRMAGRADLRFVRMEPRLIPKRELNGDPAELVDMRVAQAIYSFDPASLAARPGEQVDVFIEVPPAR